ncbi:MAG: zinc ribbon domain-containing protein [Chloroflexi bacterium]|nr:zinc ribbon domain-containing protein [Chloroflexota bacterium]
MNGINCRNCNNVNPLGSKFCNHCGTQLPPQTTQICASCGTTNPQNRLYCDNCGNRLGKPVNIPGEEKSGGEISSPPPSRQGFILPSRRPGDTGELDPDDLPEWLKTGERPGVEPDPERQSRITDWLHELTELTEKEDQDRFTIDYGFLERPKWPGRERSKSEEEPAASTESLPEDLFQTDSSPDEPALATPSDWLADLVDPNELDLSTTPADASTNNDEWQTELPSSTPSPSLEDEWLTNLPELDTTGDLAADAPLTPDWLADFALPETNSPTGETSDWLSPWEEAGPESVSQEETQGQAEDWLADLAPAEKSPDEMDWTANTALAVEDWLAALDETNGTGEAEAEPDLFNWDEPPTDAEQPVSPLGKEVEDSAAANLWPDVASEEETDLSSWLSELETEEPDQLAASPLPTAEGQDDFAAASEASVTDWLANWPDEAATEPASQDDSADFILDEATVSPTPAQDEPDEESEPAPENFDLMGWLQELETDAGEDDVEAVAATHLVEDDLPDWLTETTTASDERAFALLDDSLSTEESSPEPSHLTDTPDWLSELRAPDTTFFAQPAEEFTPATTDRSADNIADELPDWMGDLMGEASATPSAPDAPGLDWAAVDEEPVLPPSKWEESRPGATDDRRAEPHELVRGELPDWLQESLNEGNIATTSGRSTGLPDLSLPQDDLPDWLAAQPGEQDFSSALESALSAQGSTMMGGSFDSEWTDILGDLPPGEEVINLEEGSIPEWIQELKPRELTGLEPEPVEENEELTGPLIGMRHVIPIEPVIAQPKRNVAAATRYTLTKEHQQQAALLHQLIHAEPQMVTRMGHKHQAMSVVTRLVLTGLLLATVGLGLILPWFDITLPLALPAPLPGVAAAQQSIAAASGTIALVAFEYTPGMAGELDPQATLILNQLSASGKELVAVSQYSAGIGQANSLGIPFASTQFVAGETIGLRNLAGCLNSNENCTGPLGLTDFDAQQVGLIVVLTSDRESLLGWIEQVAVQTDIPMVVGTTQGLAPVAQPYLESGQIAGLMPGLPGAAAYEQAISGGQAGAISDQLQAQTLAQLGVVLVFILGALYYGFKGLGRK